MSADGWRRVSRRHPCPVCDKPDWCLVSPDGSAAICARTESPKRCGEAGHLHKLRDTDDWRQHPRTRHVSIQNRMVANPRRFAELAADFAVKIPQEQVDALADQLGVTELSLHRLGIGWDGCAFTFPMKDSNGLAIGIRRRFRNGDKRAIRGSKNGLFIPIGLSGQRSLLICEGESDAAALLSIGFDAIGRPGCRNGVQLVCGFAKGRGVVVVADGDEPGRLGAEALASVLRVYCPTVRIIQPPDDMKDAREWVKAGATSVDIQSAIDAAGPLHLGVKGAINER